jgi:ATP-dependent Clp protease adaptor protein ClpS
MVGDNSGNRQDGSDGGIEILDRPQDKLKRPGMFTVFVHNDPFTPREFVVGVLQQFFNKTMEQAFKVMQVAHTKGMGAAGTYTKEIAETKADRANAFCRKEGRVLTFSVQEE